MSFHCCLINGSFSCSHCRVTAEVKHNSTTAVVCRVQGEWNGVLEFTYTSGETRVVDVTKLPVTRKHVRPVEKQGPTESRSEPYYTNSKCTSHRLLCLIHFCVSSGACGNMWPSTCVRRTSTKLQSTRASWRRGRGLRSGTARRQKLLGEPDTLTERWGSRTQLNIFTPP